MILRPHPMATIRKASNGSCLTTNIREILRGLAKVLEVLAKFRRDVVCDLIIYKAALSGWFGLL